MTKKRIFEALTLNGINASYSGKSKTFYCSRLPMGILLANIEETGFKVDLNLIKK